MAVKYLCCDCDFDMTQAVENACNQGPDVRPALQFKGMKLMHAAATVVLTCPNGHTCQFPCAGTPGKSMSDDTVVRGTYVAPEVKAQFDSLQAFFDARASLDRIDSYGKWIFASSAIVGALGAGLSNEAFSRTHGASLLLLALSILCLGVSLVAACQSIAPAVVQVSLENLDDMRAVVNRQFSSRQRYVSVAARAYALAIFLAALVPLLSLLTAKATPRVTYAVDAKGVLVADLALHGSTQGETFALDVEHQGTQVAETGVVADASGEAILHVGPIALDAGDTVLVVRQRSSGGGNWKELQRIPVVR